MKRIDPEEQREIILSWLNHPGTKIMTRKVRAASIGLLRRYDTASAEQLAEIQAARWFFNKELPRIIEAAMNPDMPQANWTWRIKDWLKKIVMAR